MPPEFIHRQGLANALRYTTKELNDTAIAIESAADKALKLELAADYLVMAAWLAFLKSRLLLPREGGETADVSAEELARTIQEAIDEWIAGPKDERTFQGGRAPSTSQQPGLFSHDGCQGAENGRE